MYFHQTDLFFLKLLTIGLNNFVYFDISDPAGNARADAADRRFRPAASAGRLPRADKSHSLPGSEATIS